MENFDYYFGLALICVLGICVSGFLMAALWRLDCVSIIAGAAMLQAVRIMVREQKREFNK